jgi:uncharacterized SAM-binding protein YcdF (DUF218 family)
VEKILGGPADLGILLGNAVLQTTEAFAFGVRQRAARRWMISGGIGHSTSLLYDAVRDDPRFTRVQVEGRAEADILEDVLYELGAEATFLLETRSTNCGGNAIEACRALEDARIRPQSILLVQDPTMMRRSMASFQNIWEDQPEVRFLACPSFVPSVAGSAEGMTLDPSGAWRVERFLSLLLGEIPRLRDAPGGYGPRGAGYIVHVDIPSEVQAAHARLAEAFQELAGR